MRRLEQVRVDGVMLSAIVAWDGLEYIERLDGGCLTATWSLEGATSSVWAHPAIRRGALVEILVGPEPVWVGVLSEPDVEAGTMAATGLASQAEHAVALAAGGTATASATVGIDQAIARGTVDWVGHRGFPSVAISPDPEPNYLSALLSAACEGQGLHWGVGPDRVAYAVAEPTTEPRYRLTPGAGILGVADDDYVTHLVGRYRISSTALATVIVGDDAAAARWDRRERPVDLTGRPVMTTAAAQALLAGMLAKIGPRPGWTTGLTVDRWQLTTSGGVPTFGPWVRAGERIRLHGVQGVGPEPTTYQDITIGEIRHVMGSDVLYIQPQGMAARNYEAIMEEALRA